MTGVAGHCINTEYIVLATTTASVTDACLVFGEMCRPLEGPWQAESWQRPRWRWASSACSPRHGGRLHGCTARHSMLPGSARRHDDRTPTRKMQPVRRARSTSMDAAADGCTLVRSLTGPRVCSSTSAVSATHVLGAGATCGRTTAASDSFYYSLI